MELPRIRIVVVALFLFFNHGLLAQTKLTKQSVEVLNGQKVELTELVNKEGPTVISFWATWCKPCILELNEMQDLYSDWIDETNVKIIAVSIDDSRSADKVRSFVNGKGWEFEVVLDKNSNLKRALNINNVPYTMIVNRDQEIVWQHSGYVPGDEELVFEKLESL